MLVFRVSFTGPELAEGARAGLDGPDSRWEGSARGPAGPSRHRALVGARTADEALNRVRDALQDYGDFKDFDVVAVRDLRGEIRHTPVPRYWDDIDWGQVNRTSPTSELQRQVLGAMLDAAEPTWIIARDLQDVGDRHSIEAALQSLAQRNLVYSRWSQLFGPSAEPEMGYWWALTDQGWDLLGLIKSPSYR